MIQRFSLLAEPFLEIARGQSPFRVGTASPCPGAGARRIDENAIEFFLEWCQGRLAVMHLHTWNKTPHTPTAKST